MACQIVVLQREAKQGNRVANPPSNRTLKGKSVIRNLNNLRHIEHGIIVTLFGRTRNKFRSKFLRWEKSKLSWWHVVAAYTYAMGTLVPHENVVIGYKQIIRQKS